MPGAAITLEAGLGLTTAGAAAVCFKPASGYDFTATQNEIAELLELSGKDTGSEITQTVDSYGYHWIVVRDPDLDDLVTSVHMVNASLDEKGYSHQLLATVFAFGAQGGGVGYLVYLFKRGTFYPFVPAPGGGEKRDNQRELQIRARSPARCPSRPTSPAGSRSGALPFPSDSPGEGRTGPRWAPLNRTTAR